MSKASEAELSDLHGALARGLTDIIKDGVEVPTKEGSVKVTAPAAYFGAAVALLKNNNITADPSKNEELDALTKALVAGMTIVGADFRDGILFVPEVLLAANAASPSIVFGTLSQFCFFQVSPPSFVSRIISNANRTETIQAQAASTVADTSRTRGISG